MDLARLLNLMYDGIFVWKWFIQLLYSFEKSENQNIAFIELPFSTESNHSRTRLGHKLQDSPSEHIHDL